MARRRLQRKGYVFRKGPSWYVQYRDPNHNPQSEEPRPKCCEIIADAIGPNAVKSKREAQRLAWELVLSKLDQRTLRPASTMNLADFVKTKFELQVVAKKKPAGQKHYRYVLDHHVVPALGNRRMCDISGDDVEDLIALKRDEGYSGQTVLHVKNAVSAIFRLAKKLRLYVYENPAAGIEMPEVRRVKRPTLTVDQAARALAALASPVREMALLSIATSLGPAEMLGLRRKHVNFTGQMAMTEDGEALAPHSIAVRENYYEGEYGTLKAGARKRNIGLPPELSDALRQIASTAPRQDADAPVFQSRAGTPLDAHNISNRVLRPLGKKLGFALTWYSFRRAHSTFAAALGIPAHERQALMGHADARMSLYYDVADVERRRAVPQRIVESLMGTVKGGVQ